MRGDMPSATLCFSLFFVLFERGSKSPSGRWSQVFVKAQPNISDGVPSELGVLSFELGIILGFACDFELEGFVLFFVFLFVGA